jgi:Transposase
MKRKRFTEEQITFALRQAESGTPVAEVIRKLGITGRPSTSMDGSPVARWRRSDLI